MNDWFYGWPHPDLKDLDDAQNFEIVEVCPGTVKSRRRIAALTPSPDHAELIGRLEEWAEAANRQGNNVSLEPSPNFDADTRADMKTSFYMQRDLLTQAAAAIRTLTSSLSRVEGECSMLRADVLAATETIAREAKVWPAHCPDNDGIFIAAPDDVIPILDEYASEHNRPSAGISYSDETVSVGDLRRIAALHARLSRASAETDKSS